MGGGRPPMPGQYPGQPPSSFGMPPQPGGQVNSSQVRQKLSFPSYKSDKPQNYNAFLGCMCTYIEVYFIAV